MTEEEKLNEEIQFLEKAVNELTEVYAFLSEDYDSTNGDEMSAKMTYIDSYFARVSSLLADAEYLYDVRIGEIYDEHLDAMMRMSSTAQNRYLKSKCPGINKVISKCKNALEGLKLCNSKLMTQLAYQKESMRIVKTGY